MQYTRDELKYFGEKGVHTITIKQRKIKMQYTRDELKYLGERGVHTIDLSHLSHYDDEIRRKKMIKSLFTLYLIQNRKNNTNEKYFLPFEMLSNIKNFMYNTTYDS